VTPREPSSRWLRPFFFFAAIALLVMGKGYSFSDYPNLVSSGEVPWFPQVVGWLCVVAWIVRYFLALGGRCGMAPALSQVMEKNSICLPTGGSASQASAQ
jgi:hypothetical protein